MSESKRRPVRGLLFALVLVVALFVVGALAPVVVYDCERQPGGAVNCVVHERAWGVLPVRDQSLRRVADVSSETKSQTVYNSDTHWTSQVDKTRLILSAADHTSIRPGSWSADKVIGSENVDIAETIRSLVRGSTADPIRMWQGPFAPTILGGILAFLALGTVLSSLAMLFKSN